MRFSQGGEICRKYPTCTPKTQRSLFFISSVLANSIMSDWDFADGVTVLGYFVIAMWLLGALFQVRRSEKHQQLRQKVSTQIGINIAHRCLPSVSTRYIFVGATVVSLVLLALSLFYLVRKSPTKQKGNIIRTFFCAVVSRRRGRGRQQPPRLHGVDGVRGVRTLLPHAPRGGQGGDGRMEQDRPVVGGGGGKRRRGRIEGNV